jgi:N-acetylneuraminate synthase
LLKGQISTREFAGGERLTHAVAANQPVDVRAVGESFTSDPQFIDLILDRGLDPSIEPAVPARAKLAS